MLEVLIGKEIELVKKVPNVDTAERVHLGEWQDAGESAGQSVGKTMILIGALT